jgi:hypothetical protein
MADSPSVSAAHPTPSKQAIGPPCRVQNALDHAGSIFALLPVCI